MKWSLVSLILFSVAAVSWADDCTYDRDAQLEMLRTIAASHSGAVLSSDEGAVKWTDPDGSETLIRYGGCEDLGFSVSQKFPRNKKLSDQDAFSIAKNLAATFWDSAEAGKLATLIDNKAFNREQAEHSVFYHLSVEFYSEFYIEHREAENSVVIAWVRNF